MTKEGLKKLLSILLLASTPAWLFLWSYRRLPIVTMFLAIPLAMYGAVGYAHLQESLSHSLEEGSVGLYLTSFALWFFFAPFFVIVGLVFIEAGFMRLLKWQADLRTGLLHKLLLQVSP